jgi:putative tricarboxylic transport membrane protein
MLAELADGFATALTLQYLLLSLLGVGLGTAIGVLPGLGPAATISLLLPITFAAGDPIGAFVLFGGVFYGAMYGGSTTSILINTPGESSSVVTTLDGYQMARRGRGGAALACAAIGSFIAGTLATVGLMVLAEPLVSVALDFGAPEYFALMLLALSIVVTLGGRPSKALFALCLGLAIGTVGVDFQTGQTRFSFGVPELYEGIDAVTAAIGLFAISEVLFGIGQLRKARRDGTATMPIGRLFMTRREWKQSFGPWLRGSVLGFVAGTLPGVGASIASFMSYGLEKMIGRSPRRFGRGDIRGVAGPEAANNAAMGGHLVPLLILGIPGSATTAVLLAAFQGYGIRTGPLLLEQNAQLVWTLIASLYIGNVMLLVLNLPLVGIWVRLLRVPRELLYASIVVISALGVYSLKNSVFDVYVMMAFGVVGFVLRRAGFPLAPVILGLLLGPLLEVQFRQALTLSGGDWSVFLSSALAVGLLVAALLVCLSPLLVRRSRRGSDDGDHDDATDSPVLDVAPVATNR